MILYRASITVGPRRSLGLAALAALIGLIALAAPSIARADDGFDGERFQPAAGAAGWLTAESPVVPFHLGYGLGLFLNVADDAVVVRDRDRDVDLSRPLDLAFSANILASIGLWDRLELAVDLPVRIIYDGDPYNTGVTTLDASAGLGDLRLVPKLTIWGTGSERNHFVLGAALPVGLPTGDDEALRGANAVTLQPELLLLGRIGRLGLIGNAGYRWRSAHPARLPIGDELAFALGASFDITESLGLFTEWTIAQQLSTDVDGGSTELPIEGMLGLTYRPTPSWTIYAGGGLGVSDGIGAPDVRGILGIRYAPGNPSHDGFGDSDHDGVTDRDDDCADQPEDEDGFADEDGCPEPDNDGDGIADDDDECPDQPEEAGGDRDGCPDKTYVKIEDGKIFIFGKVRFRTGSAEIDPSSDALLDQVAVALKGNPDKRIRVEGHSDSTGSRDVNQDLSEKRAASVREALIKRGVDSDHLESKGYGESHPIAPNKTAAGRAKNRRVEFVITD